MKNKEEYNHKPKVKTVLRIYLWLDYHCGLTVLNYLNPSFLKLDPSLKLFFAHFFSFLESVIWLPTAISGPSSREQPYSRNVNHCIVTTFHPKVTDRQPDRQPIPPILVFFLPENLVIKVFPQHFATAQKFMKISFISMFSSKHCQKKPLTHSFPLHPFSTP